MFSVDPEKWVVCTSFRCYRDHDDDLNVDGEQRPLPEREAEGFSLGTAGPVNRAGDGLQEMEQVVMNIICAVYISGLSREAVHWKMPGDGHSVQASHQLWGKRGGVCVRWREMEWNGMRV